MISALVFTVFYGLTPLIFVVIAYWALSRERSRGE